LFAAALPTQE